MIRPSLRCLPQGFTPSRRASDEGAFQYSRKPKQGSRPGLAVDQIIIAHDESDLSSAKMFLIRLQGSASRFVTRPDHRRVERSAIRPYLPI
jgi:hypothetical protein